MDKISIARFVALIVGLLAYFGVNVPDTVTEAVVAIVVGVWAIWSAWKDNDITKKAVHNKEFLKNKGMK